MGPDPRAKEVFLDALDREASEREAFVEVACSGVAGLRERVDELLRAHVGADRFLGDGAARLSGFAARVDVRIGDRIGAYRLERVLGEGGFGIVFEAEQEEPVRRRVALKIVKLGMDTVSVIGRFEAERQALALMDHPGIARVFDAGATDSGRPYFVMELVDGVAITKHCADAGLATRARLELFRTVCLAVQHAHQKGVIHRDLKPNNVLVTMLDGVRVPKVIDFGIAKATGERLTENTVWSTEGHLIGTPAYMSPEQAGGSTDIDTRSDVYSLGVLLYELLSGAPPFDVRELGLLELQRAIQHEDPPRPSTQRRRALASGGDLTDTARVQLDVPADLDWIVMRALEKDPSRRYPTAYAFALDIGRFLDDQPVEAAPPGVVYRLGKLAARHRAATVASVLVGASLVVGATAASLGWIEARRANRELDGALVRAEAEAERAGLAERRASEDARRARDAEALAASRAREARRQADVARAVNDFLNQDLLGAAAPSNEQGRGRDVTMREVLDVAADRIDRAAGGRFAGEPLVEAAIRDTLGRTYDALGRLPEAERHLRRAAELVRAELGPNDPGALRADSLRGHVLVRLGRVDEAETLLARTLEAQTEVLGSSHRDTAKSVSRLGTVHRALGRHRDAIELHEAALRAWRGSDAVDRETGAILAGGLGILYAQTGRHDEAESLFVEAVGARESEHGPDHPLTLAARQNLLTFYQTRGRTEAAVELARDLFETIRELVGPEHPDTLVSMGTLAGTLRQHGRLDEAEELYRTVVEVGDRLFGPEHEGTLSARGSLGTIAMLRGRPADAEAIFRDVVELSTRLRGREHLLTVAFLRSLADALHRLGRDDEARPLLEEVLESERSTFGDDHPMTLGTRLNLAVTDKVAGRMEDAERGLREVLARAPGRSDAAGLRVDASRHLAQVLIRGSRFAEAEEAARASLELAREAFPPSDWHAPASLVCVGQALTGLGRLAEAEAPIGEALRELQAAFGADFEWTREAALRLAELYERGGAPDEAATVRAAYGLPRPDDEL